jgi:dTDP-4-dehydrorhamnose 3,5-epimerase
LKFTPLKIKDIILIEPQVFSDNRGFFLETYHKEKFEKAGIKANFVQDNHSKSVRGTLRGLHYQTNPMAQGKLVRVIAGTIFDVAVDIRVKSGTFGQWVGQALSSNNKHMLYIPPGFAHGFYVLSEVAQVEYKCTSVYSPQNEHSIYWEDKKINIIWPLIDQHPPILSNKDLQAPILDEAFLNF